MEQCASQNMNAFMHYRNETRNIYQKCSFLGPPILTSSQQTEKQCNTEASLRFDLLMT